MSNQMVVIRLTVMSLVLGLATCAMGQDCDAPLYKKGKQVLKSKSETVMEISIAPDRFNRKDLYCLATKLLKDFAPAKKISIGIFNDVVAAKHAPARMYTLEMSHADLHFRNKRHAVYEYDSESGEDYILLLPQGASRDFEMHIDSNSRALPQCTISLSEDRCLVTFNYLEYPPEAWWATVSGTVTMTAVVQKDGSVSKIAVENVVAQPASGASILQRAALENFSSWYFERAKGSYPVTLTFKYGLTGQPSGVPKTHLDFSLPKTVFIATNPPLEGQRKPLK